MKIFSRVTAVLTLISALAFASHSSPVQSGNAVSEDSTMALKGGAEGTVLKSMTVKGEDRVKIEFERPPLDLELDPYSAPGLDWDSTWEILDRSTVDYISPLILRSSSEGSGYLPRPWLEEFREGDLVRFRPAVKDVEKWRLEIVDSHSETVAVFEGKGTPPDEISWNGLSSGGMPAIPGLTYSYVLEAYDRAGNKRNFVGEGFKIPSYQYEAEKGMALVFSGERVMSGYNIARHGISKTPDILLDAANRINQVRRAGQVVTIEARARTFEEAAGLADNVLRSMRPLLLGDPAGIKRVTEVEPDSPPHGTVLILVGR